MRLLRFVALLATLALISPPAASRNPRRRRNRPPRPPRRRSPRRSCRAPKASRRPRSRAEDFAARLQKISGDAFEGRKPGTIGERMTTAWIKDQFEQIGLKPGNGGNWFQTVPMVETTLLDAGRGHARRRDARRRRAFRISHRHDRQHARRRATTVDIEDSPIVFAGYGVVAPEQNWNDYAGLDVKGKTVVVLVNDPGWGNHDETLFKGNALTYYGRWTYKYEEAARQGAAACLIVHETAGRGLSVGCRRQQLVRSAGCAAAARGSGAAPAGRRLAHDRSRAASVRESRREFRRAEEERRRARLQAESRSTRSSRRISRTGSTTRARRT